MKSIGKILLSIFIFIMGINAVYAAEDEYAIYFEKDGNEVNIRVAYSFDETENIGEEYTGNTDSIYSYNSSTHTLTLKEGVHYLYIDTMNMDEITITSNNKKVYANMIYGQTINLDELYSESYKTDVGYVFDTFEENNSSTKMMTHIHCLNLNIKDSDVRLNKEKYEYDGIIHTVDTMNNQQYDSLGDITIQNSKVEVGNLIYIIQNRKLTIKDDSYVKAGILACLGSDILNDTAEIIIKDSNVEVSKNEITQFFGEWYHAVVLFNKITIDNSNINTNAMWRSFIFNITKSNMFYTDDLERFSILGITTNELNVTNSDLDISGAIVGQNITLTNSHLSSITGPNALALETMGYDGSTMSALVSQNMILINSDFKAVSEGDVPAVAIGNITSDKENFVLHTDDYKILDLETVTLEDYGFFTNPNSYSVNYNNDYIRSLGITSAKTALLNGEAARTVITGETVEMTIKVVNGTWEDGTSDAKTVTLIAGQIPDKNMFKTKTLKNNQALSIERTGDNEYSYIYSDIQNPKTGVTSVTIILLISILTFVGVYYFKDEFSMFKRL